MGGFGAGEVRLPSGSWCGRWWASEGSVLAGGSDRVQVGLHCAGFLTGPNQPGSTARPNGLVLGSRACGVGSSRSVPMVSGNRFPGTWHCWKVPSSPGDLQRGLHQPLSLWYCPLLDKPELVDLSAVLPLPNSGLPDSGFL
jgi:hypothetical protein